MAIESLGKLDKYAEVFDIKKYLRENRPYKIEQILEYNTSSFAHDNVDFAREHGMDLPSLPQAKRYRLKKRLRRFCGRALRKIHLR